ncbi:tRNA dihydrouridine(20/20a) synthase DusA [Frigidibacter sp. MR17.24]|uniref:tRNA dihydrouridine(20/20a) synthase DusA n=1 Tax=Frigidibacter sp. MR17.24 TaxID=3127345 RepID=UPI003FA582B3
MPAAPQPADPRRPDSRPHSGAASGTDSGTDSGRATRAARLSVAPMLDWTDRECRFFHRLLSREALLYTEMVVDQAIIHGPRARLLDFSPAEHPVALQIGGSDPATLAEAARVAAGWGYDEINLNCGCPSDRVQSGCFGAVLMKDPDLVARGLEAMAAAAPGTEITVKCRIGVDDQDPAEVLPAFLARIREAGVRRVIVHARKAWLQGLSPHENRTVPPLDYDLVVAMKHAFPDLHVSVNGGIETLEAAQALLDRGLDGAMIGRAAYHRPWDILGTADPAIFGTGATADPHGVLQAMRPRIETHVAQGGRLHQISRHMLGLFHGRPGARLWRRRLSEEAARVATPAEALALLDRAEAEVTRAAA